MNHWPGNNGIQDTQTQNGVSATTTYLYGLDGIIADTDGTGTTHYHLQDGPAFPDAESMPAAFVNYLADGVPVARGEPVKGQRVRNR